MYAQSNPRHLTIIASPAFHKRLGSNSVPKIAHVDNCPSTASATQHVTSPSPPTASVFSNGFDERIRRPPLHRLVPGYTTDRCTTWPLSTTVHVSPSPIGSNGEYLEFNVSASFLRYHWTNRIKNGSSFRRSFCGRMSRWRASIGHGHGESRKRYR